MHRPAISTLSIVALAAALGAAVAVSHRVPAEESSQEKKAAPADKEKAAALSRFMRQKLAASNQVLEGLVTEDFALIEKGAATMLRLSQAEEWRISNDALYRHHSAEFRRIVESLQKKAQDRQLEGAALSWVEGTMSCIACHKWVRNMIVAE